FFNNMFLRNEIELDKIEHLCTLKLAKRILHNNTRFNVGALSRYFDIRIMNRHRAYDDAIATALVLLELIDIAQNEHNINTVPELLKFQSAAGRPSKAKYTFIEKIKEKIDDLPDFPGVYYFKDKFNKILYIGKAKSIRKRIS